jgi:hypothetical protein
MFHAKLINKYFKTGNILPNQTHIARIYNGLSECKRKKIDVFTYTLKAIELSRLLRIKGLVPATKGIEIGEVKVITSEEGRERLLPNETCKLRFKLGAPTATQRLAGSTSTETSNRLYDDPDSASTWHY